MQSVHSEQYTETVPENFLLFKWKYRVTTGDNKISLSQKSHLEIKESTDVRKCLAYCIDIMFMKEIPHVRLSCVSNNMDKCIMIAEMLKRKVKNLHQVNTFQTLSYPQFFTPIVNEPGFEKFELQKSKTVFHILLSRQCPTNKTQAGYQKPIDTKLVSIKDPRDYMRKVLDETLQPKKKQVMSDLRDKFNHSDSESDLYEEYIGQNHRRNKHDGFIKPTNRANESHRNEPSEKLNEQSNKGGPISKNYRAKDEEDVVYREKVDPVEGDNPDYQFEPTKKSGPRVKWETMPEVEGSYSHVRTPFRKQFRDKGVNERRGDTQYAKWNKHDEDEDLDKTLYPVQVNDFQGEKGRDNRDRIRRQKEAEFGMIGKTDNILGGLDEPVQPKEGEVQTETNYAENQGHEKSKKKISFKEKHPNAAGGNNADYDRGNGHQESNDYRGYGGRSSKHYPPRDKNYNNPRQFVETKQKSKRKFDEDEIEYVRKD